MIGTLINAGAVITGSCIGLLLHTRLPRRIVTIVFQALGLFTIFLGVTMALKTQNFLVMIFSLVTGSIIGEAVNIALYMERFTDFLKQKLNLQSQRFTEGFITAFILFCVGSMTILGAFEEGLGGKPNLLMTKSVMDGFSSIALSAAFGIGVIFSVIPLLLYQGGLTLFASSLQDILSEALINEMTAVGGILLIGLGIDILEIKRLRILNMVPALLVAILLAYFAKL